MVRKATRGCRLFVSSPSILFACLMRAPSTTRRPIIIMNNNHNNHNHAAWGAVSRVTTMNRMFYYAYDFNQDISSWDGK